MTQVAQTILEQLGGRKFVVMTGAKGFLADGDSLMFSLPPNFAKNGINKVRVTLEPSDTYRVEFMKLSTREGDFKVATIAETDDIYCDMLQEVFTRYTGLDTRL